VKLLIYSHYFAPSIGGVETIVGSLSDGLAERRTPAGGPEFEVTLITQTPAGSFDDKTLPFAIVRNPGFARLFRLIRASDVVHLAGPSLIPLALALLLRTPVIVEHHGYQAICPNGLLFLQPQRIVCPGHFQAGRYLDCIRCQSHKMPVAKAVQTVLLTGVRNGLCRMASVNIAITHHVLERHGLPRSEVVYYGIRDAPLLPEKISSASPPASRLSIAFVGRFVEEKGLHILLEAARKLRDMGREFDLLLVGDGPERASLESRIAALSLSSCVRITGFVSGEALRENLRGINAVVMPSIWEETAGLAAIEQMMRGGLVIASAIGGLREVVGDAGLTCRPGDAESLAQCILRVLDDLSLIEKYGRPARARASSIFGRDRMLEAHAQIYHRVHAEPPCG